MPSLNKARAAAKTSQCLNNLKQCTLGIQLYAGDHRGYAFIQWSSSQDKWPQWYGGVIANLGGKYIKQQQMTCPSAHFGKGSPYTIESLVADKHTGYGIHGSMGRAADTRDAADNPMPGIIRYANGKWTVRESGAPTYAGDNVFVRISCCWRTPPAPEGKRTTTRGRSSPRATAITIFSRATTAAPTPPVSMVPCGV